MAIPLVLVFCLCTLAMAGSMFYFRKESKSEGMANIQFIQANFLAQSAIQNMLAKLSAFPQEACDAGLLSLGHCPFRSVIAGGSVTPGPDNVKETIGLKQFCSDCNTDKLPWDSSFNGDGFIASNWKYHIEKIEIISAYTINKPKVHKLVLTARITAIGEVKTVKGGLGWRKEKMVKTVQLTRDN